MEIFEQVVIWILNGLFTPYIGDLILAYLGSGNCCDSRTGTSRSNVDCRPTVKVLIISFDSKYCHIIVFS